MALGKCSRGRSPFVNVLRKAAKNDPVQEPQKRVQKTADEICDMLLAKKLPPESVKVVRQHFLASPHKLEMIFVADSKEEIKDALPDSLPPENRKDIAFLIDKSMPLLAPSGPQVSIVDELEALMTSVWSRTCPAWKKGCSCFPGTDKNKFGYETKNQMIMEQFIKLANSDKMAFEGREADMQIVKTRWSYRQAASWNRDKSNEGNALLAVTNAPGYGKSAFLVQAPAALMETNPIVAPVTYNSAMTDNLDSTMGITPLGVRVIFGAIAAMRPTEVPSECAFKGERPWTEFCSHLEMILNEQALPTGSDKVMKYLGLLRKLYAREVVFVLVDELSKCCKSEALKFDDAEVNPAESVCREVGTILDSDRKALAMVSCLSPTYAKELVTRSNRKIVLVIMTPLQEMEVNTVMRESLIPALTKVLDAQDLGRQKTVRAIEELEELVLRCARLTGGHARTLESLINALKEKEKSWLDAVVRNDVNFAAAFRLFEQMGVCKARLRAPKFMGKILDQQWFGGTQLVTLVPASNHQCRISEAIEKGEVHVVQESARDETYLIDVLPVDIIGFIRAGRREEDALEIVLGDEDGRCRALCFLLKPAMQQRTDLTPAYVQERLALYCIVSEMLRGQESGHESIFTPFAHSQQWVMHAGDALVIHDYSTQTSAEFYEQINTVRQEANQHQWHLILAPAGEQAVDAVAISPNFLLGVQVKGGGVLSDPGKASEQWEGPAQQQEGKKRKKGTKERLDASRKTAMAQRSDGLPKCDEFLAVCFFDPPSSPLTDTVNMTTLRAHLPGSLLSLALASAAGEEET